MGKYILLIIHVLISMPSAGLITIHNPLINPYKYKSKPYHMKLLEITGWCILLFVWASDDLVNLDLAPSDHQFMGLQIQLFSIAVAPYSFYN